MDFFSLLLGLDFEAFDVTDFQVILLREVGGEVAPKSFQCKRQCSWFELIFVEEQHEKPLCVAFHKNCIAVFNLIM